MTTPKVSGVVLSYGRTANIPRIVAGMLEQPWMDDVVVWHNPGYMAPPVIEHESVTVIAAEKNVYTLGRHKALAHCRHMLVATVDDDNLPRNWQAIYDGYQAHPDVITASIRTPGHMRLDAKLRWGTCHEVLLGWGSMFNSGYCLRLCPYTEKYGWDDEVLMRKFDRLLALMWNEHHNVIPADFEELPGALDNRVALGVRKDHGRLTIEARHRAFEILGITQ